ILRTRMGPPPAMLPEEVQVARDRFAGQFLPARLLLLGQDAQGLLRQPPAQLGQLRAHVLAVRTALEERDKLLLRSLERANDLLLLFVRDAHFLGHLRIEEGPWSLHLESNL